LYTLVASTHCRNAWLAGTLGALAGLVGYLGYYQLCLAHRLPAEFVGRVDLLPRYIVFRMNTDVAEGGGRPPLDQPRKPFVALNWFTFAWELLMVVGAAAGLAWTRARHAYCPELGKWMQREKALLPPNVGPVFRGALETGRLAQFVAATPAGGNP